MKQKNRKYNESLFFCYFNNNNQTQNRITVQLLLIYNHFATCFPSTFICATVALSIPINFNHAITLSIIFFVVVVTTNFHCHTKVLGGKFGNKTINSK